jgi:hypothetical protein
MSSLAPPFFECRSSIRAAEALGTLDWNRLGAGLLRFWEAHRQDAIFEGV